MRDTPYATELATGSVKANKEGGELRVERLHIKEYDRPEIRWSWWVDGKIANRPLDLTEGQLLDLFKVGMKNGVFTTDFLVGLRNRIDAVLAAK